MKTRLPRYQVADIIKESPKLLKDRKDQDDYFYLILHKKYAAISYTEGDLYQVLCMNTGKIGDAVFQESFSHAYDKVA